MVEKSSQETGNLAYHVNRDPGNPTIFYLYDRWNSIDAVDFHEQTEYFKVGLVTLKEVVAKPIETTILQIVY